jgi:hypothetical protein
MAVVQSPSGAVGMPSSQSRPVPYEGMMPTRGSESHTELGIEVVLA